MPISGNQNLNPNSTKFSLPTDTQCVGQGGPTPQQAATISKPVSKKASY